MKSLRESLLLYAVTDSHWTTRLSLLEQVEAAICGGVTMVQYREKHLGYQACLNEARAIGELCRRYEVPFIVNDDPLLAREAQADGVHVGQEDYECSRARKIVGRDKIVGVSAQTVEQAVRAYEAGADYLGVGALFPTATKGDALLVSLETLKEIVAAVPIPVVGIGGIGSGNLEKLRGLGLAGAALVSAIFGQEDIKSATEALRHKLQSWN